MKWLELCEKNFPKSTKIGKNQKKSGKYNITISVACNNFRRLGNLEVLTTNPLAAGSNPAPDKRDFASCFNKLRSRTGAPSNLGGLQISICKPFLRACFGYIAKRIVLG